MSGRPRPLGLASTGRPAGSKSALAGLRSRRRGRSQGLASAVPRARLPARLLARSPARPERAAHGPQLSQLAGERAARPPARRVAAAASAPTQGGGLESGPRGRDPPRSVTWRALAALGATRGPGKGGKSGTRGPPRWWWWRRRRTREPLAPDCQVAVLATHTLAGGSRSPQATAVARAQVPELFDPPDPCAGVALGRASKCWLRLSNRG